MADQKEEEIMKRIQDLDVEELMLVGEALSIPNEKLQEKRSTRKSLLRLVMRTFNSEDYEKLEDEGFSTYLHIDSLIDKMRGESDETPASEMAIDPPVNSENSDDTSTLVKNYLKFKELKINGRIKNLDQKDGLSFSSLIFQVNKAVEKGYSESEIISAVVKSIAPEVEMRVYLEGRKSLSLKSLSKILRSHYQEKDATSLFYALANAKQSTNENAQQFAIRLMTLRQKVLFVSKEEALPFSSELVQQRYNQSILTGMKSEHLRNELRPILKSKTISDEELLGILTTAMIEEKEHLEKFNNKPPKRVEVRTIDSADISDEKNTPKKENPIVAEIKTLQNQINELRELHTDAILNYDDSRRENRFNNRRRGTNSRGNNRRNNRKRPKCSYCDPDKTDEICDHCFKCGSTEHFQSGCKSKQKN